MSMFIVHGSWRRASSPPNGDLKAQPIAGKHAPFALPTAPAPVRGPSQTATPTDTHHAARAAATADAIDDFFGATCPSQHDSDPRQSIGSDLVPLPPSPPPYADTDLPPYATATNEPTTLAKYLFTFGFLFPPFWFLGAIILVLPLTAPTDFEPSKSGSERARLVRVVREAELRWAKRCAWALVALVTIAGLVLAIVLAVRYP